MEVQSERLGGSTPDLHSSEGDSKLREHEDRGPGPECTLGDGQDGGDAHGIDRAQSGKSRGKSWCSCRTTVRC